MKGRKHSKRSLKRIHSIDDVRRKTSHLVTAYDIARFSAETIYYRTVTMQRAAASPFDPEVFTMMAEKVLAATEAAAIATRHIGPMQRLWTGAWFDHLSGLQRALLQKQTSHDAGRTLADMTMLWLKASNLLDAAARSQMKPIHRTVKGNARRLENQRIH